LNLIIPLTVAARSLYTLKLGRGSERVGQARVFGTFIRTAALSPVLNWMGGEVKPFKRFSLSWSFGFTGLKPRC
jgi:hypothetical protein